MNNNKTLLIIHELLLTRYHFYPVVTVWQQFILAFIYTIISILYYNAPMSVHVGDVLQYLLLILYLNKQRPTGVRLALLTVLTPP